MRRVEEEEEEGSEKESGTMDGRAITSWKADGWSVRRPIVGYDVFSFFFFFFWGEWVWQRQFLVVLLESAVFGFHLRFRSGFVPKGRVGLVEEVAAGRSPVAHESGQLARVLAPLPVRHGPRLLLGGRRVDASFELRVTEGLLQRLSRLRAASLKTKHRERRSVVLQRRLWCEKGGKLPGCFALTLL